jgi:hypothetical protein
VLADELEAEWLERLGKSPIDAHPTFREGRLELGAGAVLANQFANERHEVFEGGEERVRVVLSAAYRRPFGSATLAGVDAAGIFPQSPLGPLPVPATPVSASASMAGGAVVYTYPDGSQDWRIGGTVAWRTNNPGNINIGHNARSAGAISLYPDAPNNFAIFPDEQAGINGLSEVLKNAYAKSTIAATMQSYAPAKDSTNNPEEYALLAAQAVGVAEDTKVGDLNDVQFAALVQAIVKQEHSVPGQILHLAAPGLPTLEHPDVR